MSPRTVPWKLSLALVAFAIVSLSLKYLIVQSDLAMDSPAVGRQLVAALEQRGMTTKWNTTFGGVLITAEGRGCRLAVRPIPPSGELDQTFAETFRSYPRTFYSFEGALSARPPRAWPSISYQLVRMSNRVGIATRWRPLFIIGDNGACPAALTDFTAIRAPFAQQVPDAPRL